MHTGLCYKYTSSTSWPIGVFQLQWNKEVNKLCEISGLGDQKERDTCTFKANHKSFHHCWGLGMIQGSEGGWKHLLTLPSSALTWVQDKLPWQAGWGGMRRMCSSKEGHCTQAAASGMSWSLWVWACPSHSNEERMCMCRLGEAHPQGPGKDNQVSCLSYACCQSFLGFHGNWLLQKWCYENYFRDLKLTDLLCSNGSRETHHYIALHVVWSTFREVAGTPRQPAPPALCHWQPVQPPTPARGEGEEEEVEKAEKEGAETWDPISSFLVGTAHTSTRGSVVAISGGSNLLFALQSPGQHQASRCTSNVLSMWWDTQGAARSLCCNTSSGNSKGSDGGLETSAATVRLPVLLPRYWAGASLFSVCFHTLSGQTSVLLDRPTLT